MIDAAGETSTDLSMKLGRGSNGSYEISVTADKKWLDAEERQYPVRIDPATAVPSNEFIFAMASQGQPNAIFNWDGNAYVGYADSNLKNCRQYVAFNENDCESITSMLQCDIYRHSQDQQQQQCKCIYRRYAHRGLGCP